jgi:hypothetical protein
MSLRNLRWRALIAGALALLAGNLIISAFVHAQSQTPSGSQDATATPRKKPAHPPCVSPEAATQQPTKDVCVSAHVYNVVELADGTRFLDVCPADQPDGACRFTIISLAPDREDVGDLNRYRDHNIEVRGVVRSTHGRLGIVLSHVRQFNGGPEKFRPNPKLLRGFNGQTDRPPVQDSNLRSSGRHRGFMDTRDREPANK